ncbi:MAG: CHAT domain-containing protein [Myxococcota bacterium]
MSRFQTAPTRRERGSWSRMGLLLAVALLPVAASAAEGVRGEICEAPGGATPALAAVGAASQLDRGNALASRGEYGAALPEYRAGVLRAREEGDAKLVALAVANAARAAIETGKTQGGAAELQQALGSVDEFSDPGARAQLLVHVGRSYALLALRDADARRTATRRAADAFRRAGDEAALAGDERLRSYALGFLAKLYEQQGRLEEAGALTRRAIYASQLADAPDALYRWQWQLGRLAVAAGRADAGLAGYRDAVATLRDIRSQGAAPTGGFESQVEEVYGGFVDLLLTRAAGSQDADEKQALLVEARDALEDLKTAELRDYFRDPCLDAQRVAAPDSIPNTIVLYPVLLPDRAEMIVSRAGRLTSHPLPVDSETLIAEVRAFRTSLERRTSRAYLPHAHTLYDWLIRPIAPALAGASESDTLVFVPDGALRTIPFGALRDRETKQYLIQQHPVAVTPSLTLTDPRPIDTGEVRLLAAGITEAVGGYPELQEVGAEIDAIRELYPGRTLMNGNFVVDKLRAELTNVPFGIVHIASHGEFGGDASENFLLAYDGPVSMDKLAAFVGATRFRADEPLELLTLSACESAAGDDRAALGLAGVALRAGARSALATLWSVNDQATAELVVGFYGQLHQPGTSRAKALQRAQVAMLSTRHYRHPGYWAPFLLISSWL